MSGFPSGGRSSTTIFTTSSTTVLIGGAGPTGLTLAVVLARQGVPFRLIETEPGPRGGSRGKGVQPRTLEIFEDLGVIGAVLANGVLAMPMSSTGPDGRIVQGGAIPEALAHRPDIPYAASLITPEWRVEEALRRRLHEHGGAVEFGTTLVGFDPSDDGITAQVLSDGVLSTITARWLVGADGAHSTIRKQAGVPFTGQTRDDVRMILADLPITGLGPDTWQTWRHPAGLLSLCPLPSTDLFQYAASLAPGVEPRLGLADLQATLEERTGRIDIRLHEPQWASVWRANMRLADHYRVGAVLLAGDAAHVHSPAGGQGMNTGIQDAYNLGWKLDAVNAGAPPTLLDSYESERRPVAEHVLALSNARLAESIRTHSVPVRRDASTIQLDIAYRDSPLACDDRDERASLRAGDRAPDATGLTTAEGPRRLFDLTGGGRFTLLGFGAAPDLALPGSVRLLRVVDKPPGTDEIADTNGNLVAAYAASDSTLALIRPDGYLAVISDAGDPRSVINYLTRWTDSQARTRP